MYGLIVDAIRGRQTLVFTYHGERREVEPHCYGRDSKGHDAVRAYQLGGKGWRLFHQSDMGPIVTGQGFVGPRPDYKRNDSVMDVIYAQL